MLPGNRGKERRYEDRTGYVSDTGTLGAGAAAGQIFAGAGADAGKILHPAPVIGGVLFAIFTCVCYVTGVAEFAFDDILKEVCMVMFFTSVGFQANLKVLKSGGRGDDRISGRGHCADRQPELIAVGLASLLQVDPIELEFGYGIIPLADVNQGGDLLDRVVMIRRQIALELGTVVPIIRLRDNIQLNPNQYIIKIKGIQVSEGEILFDHYMAMNPGYVEEEITGIPTFEPSFHLPAIWITEGQRERAESLGYTVVDPPSIMLRT